MNCIIVIGTIVKVDGVEMTLEHASEHCHTQVDIVSGDYLADDFKCGMLVSVEGKVHYAEKGYIRAQRKNINIIEGGSYE